MKKQNNDKMLLKQAFLGCGIALVVIIVSFLFFQTVDYNKSKMFAIESGVQALKQEENIQNQNIDTPAETLALIDKYQVKYFEIVRRNDLFLQLIEYDRYETDRRDLSDLYAEVISKINTNNGFFKKYNEIENKYAENTGETTYDMNEFANNHYEAIDKLLNEVYQEIKSKISQEDFKNLTTSELKWIKDVEAYREIFDTQGYGSIGTLKYLEYKTDMHRFRILLLMLYL